MTLKDVKTLLFLNSSKVNCSFSLLFHFAGYWAQQGSRVLFISKSPVKYLPLSLGKTGASLNPDAYKLIQFMYLANYKELLQQLYSIHLRHNPVSVIIVEKLENYFKADSGIENNEDHASLICASLLYAASICSKLTLQQTVLISDYVSQDMTIDKNIIKSFFQNVWKVQSNVEEISKTEIKLSKLSPVGNDEIASFVFNESFDQLIFSQVVKKIINLW